MSRSTLHLLPGTPASLTEHLRGERQKILRIRCLTAQFTEDTPRLHGIELIPVAEQNEPRSRPQRIHQTRHEREIDHRSLIQHDQIRGNGIAGMVQRLAARRP